MRKRGYGRVALKGILLGERQAVPKNDIQSFRATGTGHLLAVSGLHIGALCWSVCGSLISWASNSG